MKTTVKAALCGVAVATVLSVSVSAADREPQVGAYMTWQFGETREMPADQFHYGMRLDYYTPGFAPAETPALLRFGFQQGQFDTFLNGMSLTALGLRLNQAEAAAGGIFGSTALTAAAVVVGVTGVAVAVNDSGSDNNDTPPGGTTAGGGTAGGDTTGGTTTGGTGGGTGGTGGGTTTGSTGGVLGGLLGGYRAEYGVEAGLAIERQRMLDGGTGYMGDLIAHD